MNSELAKQVVHVGSTKIGFSAPRVHAPAATMRAPHATVMHAPASLGYAVWVPLVAALLGAMVGAGISWLALAWSTKKEWKRRQAQARRALQIEMFDNARTCKATANAKNAGGTFLNKMLAARTLNLAFRVHFTEATEGVSWGDIRLLLDAYGVVELLFKGDVIREFSRNELENSAVKSGKKFCKAIRAMSKYEGLECAFYDEVEKLEKWLAHHDEGKESSSPATQ